MVKNKRVLIGVILLGVMGFMVSTAIFLNGRSNEFTQVNNENVDTNKFYTNPQNIELIADPFVIQVEDGTYYAYGTSDKIQATGYLVWKSKDLITWEEAGVAYMTKQGGWANKDYWAPEVVYNNNKYYMYYTARDRETKNLCIGVAVSDSPEGPFIDATTRPIIGEEYSTIDANVFIEDSKIYMYFVKDCSNNVVNGKHASEIYVVELDDDMVTLKSEPILLLTPEQPWELESGEWVWNEGPTILKENDKYYLMYSSNPYFDKMYSVGYAVSDNPLGPFKKYENNPVLSSERGWDHVSGSGHNSVIRSLDGKEIYSVYHTHMDPEEGGSRRMINIDKLGFNEDGNMYINGPSVTPQLLPSGLSKYVNKNDKISKITINGKEDRILDDGKIVYHDKDNVDEIEISGKTKVKIILSEETNLSDVMVYGRNGIEIKSIKLSSGEKFKDIANSELPGEASIVSFDEKLVQWVEIEVTGEGGLSEVIIVGKK